MYRAVVSALGASALLALATSCEFADSDTGDTEFVDSTELPDRYGNMCDPASPTSCGDEQTCEQWEGDGQFYCACPEDTERVGRNCLSEDESGLKPTCSTLSDDVCDDEGFCYDLDKEACDYLAERGIPAPDECDGIQPSGNAGDTVGICVSSTTDPLSNPHGPDAGFCDFTQFWSNPTNLPVDCRCAQPYDVSECKRPYNLSPSIEFGSGPRWRTESTAKQYGAALDGREMLVASSWDTSTLDDQGVIFAVNIDTGARRIVSGTWKDPSAGTETFGSGPDLVNAYNVRVGSDGKYYVVGGTGLAAAPVLTRVDPLTGNRERVFEGRNPDYALCSNGVPETEIGTKEINWDPRSWTMDAAGNHYFAVLAGAPGPGVVRVSPDGQSCDYLTRIVQDPDSTFEDVGTGYSDIQFYFTALEIVGDKMFALSDRQIYEIDMTTGRRLLRSDSETGAVGSGVQQLGGLWLTYDPHHEVLWSYGSPSGSNVMVAVDKETGDRTASPCWHPQLGVLEGCAGNSVGIGGVQAYGGIIIDPQPPHDVFIAFDNMSVVQLDQATLNLNIMSL